MKGRYLTHHVILLLIIVSALNSCGLKYEPPASLESLEEARREAIETHYGQSFSARNKKYHPLTYGELLVVKPESYRKLDSLFNRKYDLQQSGKTDEQLNEQIEYQRSIALNDSTPVRYVETHWFELTSDSSDEFLIHRIELDRNNSILEVEQLESFECPKELVVFARKYMTEDYFVEYVSEPSDAEIDFYTTYKERAAMLNEPQKQSFIVHTLRVMQLANTLHSLSIEKLLTRMVVQRLKETDPEISQLNFDTQRLFTTSGDQQEFLCYQVTASIPGSSAEPFVFRYDYYLEELP